jgi:uncharacterized membrane protein YoaK (UPF0700 family)
MDFVVGSTLTGITVKFFVDAFQTLLERNDTRKLTRNEKKFISLISAFFFGALVSIVEGYLNPEYNLRSLASNILVVISTSQVVHNYLKTGSK